MPFPVAGVHGSRRRRSRRALVCAESPGMPIIDAAERSSNSRHVECYHTIHSSIHTRSF